MRVDLLLDIGQPRGDMPRRARLLALETLIARGDALAGIADSLSDCLLDLFGVPKNTAPVAAFTLLADGISPDDHYWLRADPVCFRATRTRLLCAPLPDDDLSLEEAQALVAGLAPHFAGAGHQLLVGDAHRWYIRCNPAPDMRTHPPPAEDGPLTEDRMPSGADGPYWRRLMTEAQMLLHSLDVNTTREAGGKLPANGIWLWGGGRAVTIAPSPYTEVFSNEPLARGLARAAGSKTAALPENAAQALGGTTPQSSLLVVFTARDFERNLQVVDAAWASPLADALQDGRLTELRVMLMRPMNTVGRLVRPSHRRRWWRRPRALFGDA